MRQIFRYTVPVDGNDHDFELTGDPLHVGSRGEAEVEFWAENNDEAKGSIRRFSVYGTGHVLPIGAGYWGTTYDGMYPADLVWHLYEIAR